jgi:SPX domain protein involved in polyphosphate accumulation
MSSSNFVSKIYNNLKIDFSSYLDTDHQLYSSFPIGVTLFDKLQDIVPIWRKDLNFDIFNDPSYYNLEEIKNANLDDATLTNFTEKHIS